MLDPAIVYSVDFCLVVIGITLSLFYGISNLLREKRYPIHIFFSILSFTVTFLCGALLYQLLFMDSEYFTLSVRIYFVFILLSLQLFMHLHQIFPRWEMPLPKILIFATSLPGITLSVLIVMTDSIINDAAYTDYLSIENGNFFFIIPVALVTYTVGSIIILNYRKYHMENNSYRNQITHLMLGIVMSLFILLVPGFLLPCFFDIHEFINHGIVISLIILLSFNNYAISENNITDFKSFYMMCAFWLAIATITLVPASFLLENIHTISFLSIGVHSEFIAVFLLWYLVFIFSFARFVHAALTRLIATSYKQKVNKLFSEFQYGIDEKREDEYWNILLNNTVKGLNSELNIENATLFIHDVIKTKLTYCYNVGKRYNLSKIKSIHEIIAIAEATHTIIYKPELFFTEKFNKHKSKLFHFFNESGAQAVLPLFNNKVELTGLLLLGFVKGKKTYSSALFSVLELYRKKLEYYFSNALYYEELSSSPVVEQKTVSVKAVKKHILPKKLAHIKGLSLSSLYLNYSGTGGNFFTSLIPSANNLCLCISDLGNLGQDSAIRALELYAALSVQHKKDTSAMGVMNRINWVLATSRFAKGPIRFFSMNYYNSQHKINYSNAALNPLVLYNDEEGEFKDYDTRGIPLGENSDYSYTEATVSVKQNDIGFLYTDGLTQAKNLKGVPYDISRLKELIESDKSETTANIVKNIYNDFKLFTKDAPQSNDASLLLFRIH